MHQSSPISANFVVFGRLFVKRFALCYQTVVCLSCLSVTFVHCGQTVGRIKMKLAMQVGLCPGHTVLDGDPAPPPAKGHSPPQFSAHICCGHMAAWIKMFIGMELGLGPGDFVLDGDPALPPPKGGRAPSRIFDPFYCGRTTGCIKMPLGMDVGLSPGDFLLDGDPVPLPKKGMEPPPQISADFYCGQTAGCIKIPLGMEVGLSPGDFVFDGDPAPLPKKEAEPPIFGPCLLWPNGWMDEDAAWYGSRPRPRPHVLDGVPAPAKEAQQTPCFRPMSIVALELLSSCLII